MMDTNHVETPEISEISRRKVGAPSSGQLIRVMQGKVWNIDVVVWDEYDWERIPYQLRELLLELKRELGKTSAPRMVINVSKRG